MAVIRRLLYNGDMKSVSNKKLVKVNIEARKAFGQRLKHRREQLGLTQMEMALATNQAYFTFISAVETGKTKLPTQDIEAWATALKVDVSVFAKAFVQAYDVSLYNALFNGAPDPVEF